MWTVIQVHRVEQRIKQQCSREVVEREKCEKVTIFFKQSLSCVIHYKPTSQRGFQLASKARKGKTSYTG